MQHIPVLFNEVLDTLVPSPHEAVVDVTLGLAGHASVFLERTSPDGPLIALDADGDNIHLAREHLKHYASRVTVHHCNFGQISSLSLRDVDIVFADLGLSSPHLDDATRGFSFRLDGPLDLRFDRTSGVTASQLVLQSDVDELILIFRSYGELFKEARRLSTALAGKTINTTFALKAAVEEAFGFRAKPLMPQVFQALRIAVNDELRALETLLRVGPTLLKRGGRMGIISFHSLEDRMVKHAFRALTTPEKDSITGKISVEAPFELLTPKAVVPTDDEIAINPRARSAKFRAIRRR